MIAALRRPGGTRLSSRSQGLARWAPWLAASPLLLGIGVLAIYPAAALLVLSFSRSSLGRALQAWVGLGNFAGALGDGRFTAAMLRSVGFALLTTAGAMLLGLLLAVLLDRAVRAKALLRTLILLPLLTPPVTAAVAWQLLLAPTGGLVNSWLLAAGLVAQPVTFLGLGGPAIAAVCVADVWQWTPFVALMAYAALQTVDQEVLEAARVDGASEWRAFVAMTLPMLAPALWGIALIKLVIGFKVFDLVFVLTAGGPGQSTTVASLQIYRTAIQQFDIGLAAAQTLLFAVVVGLATWPFTLAHRRAEMRLP